MIEWLANRAKDVPGAVQAPATNLTLGTGVAALITAIVAAWNDAFKGIFGDNASQAIRKDVLVASIFGFAIVAAADLLARAYSKVASERSAATMAAAILRDPQAYPVAEGLTATITEGRDDPGYRVMAMRTAPGTADPDEYLLVRSDKKPQWRQADQVSIEGA
jgi:hypothetical protein